MDDAFPVASPAGRPDAVTPDRTDCLRPAPSPELHLDGFDGPLDLLLDLAERARIDLRGISIIALVEQFVAALSQHARHVPIERRAEWLVLAARLVALRSRLLFAADPEAAAEAERERKRLQDLQCVRLAASWLQARPQLGRDVFARPRRGPDPRVSSYIKLMEACLAVLEREDERESLRGVPADEAAYRLVIPALFRVPDAIVRLRTRLAEIRRPMRFEEFVPRVGRAEEAWELRARSAVSSTFVAALEIARLGEARLEQGRDRALLIVPS